MLNKRGSHGCSRLTIKNTDYVIVFGGYESTIGMMSTIHFLNLATKKWETYPNKIFLPEQMSNIHGSIVLRLDEQGCQMMIAAFYPNQRLFICEGNYQWHVMDLTGKVAPLRKMVTVGANELMPCGIYN
jgi:hypothetical protein